MGLLNSQFPPALQAEILAIVKDALAEGELLGGPVTAPAVLDASTAAQVNGLPLNLAAGATLTVNDSAWSGLPSGVWINVGQSGSATLAFSGTATKENASGTSATSVTLAASGVYALLPSPTGSPYFRLSGGASV